MPKLKPNRVLRQKRPYARRPLNKYKMGGVPNNTFPFQLLEIARAVNSIAIDMIQTGIISLAGDVERFYNNKRGAEYGQSYSSFFGKALNKCCFPASELPLERYHKGVFFSLI